MNTSSTGATNRYIQRRRASHEVGKNTLSIQTSSINDFNKGFRARASVKPISHLSMFDRNATRRYHSKKNKVNLSDSRRYNQTTSPAEATETNALSMSFGRKHYAEINELTAVRVKREEAPIISDSTPHDKHHLPSISHTVETPAHGLTISNDILLRRGHIKERLSKNLVCQGESLDATTQLNNLSNQKTPAT